MIKLRKIKNSYEYQLLYYLKKDNSKKTPKY